MTGYIDVGNITENNANDQHTCQSQWSQSARAHTHTQTAQHGYERAIPSNGGSLIRLTSLPARIQTRNRTYSPKNVPPGRPSLFSADMMSPKPGMITGSLSVLL